MGASIARGLLDSLDDQDFHRASAGTQLESKLLTDRGEQRRARIGGRVHTWLQCACRLWGRRVFELDLVPSIQARQVPHDALNVWPGRQADGQLLHQHSPSRDDGGGIARESAHTAEVWTAGGVDRGLRGTRAVETLQPWPETPILSIKDEVVYGELPGFLAQLQLEPISQKVSHPSRTSEAAARPELRSSAPAFWR